MRRLLLLLAVLCGAVWAVLAALSLIGPETLAMAQVRTLAGGAGFVLVCVAQSGERKREEEALTIVTKRPPYPILPPQSGDRRFLGGDFFFAPTLRCARR